SRSYLPVYLGLGGVAVLLLGLLVYFLMPSPQRPPAGDGEPLAAAANQPAPDPPKPGADKVAEEPVKPPAPAPGDDGQWQPPALPVQLTIKAPALSGNPQSCALPSPIEDVAVGGGGRYLILYLPAVRKLAVFDVNQAKVAHSVSLSEDGVKFTAGIDKLLVALPNTRRIER